MPSNTREVLEFHWVRWIEKHLAEHGRRKFECHHHRAVQQKPQLFRRDARRTVTFARSYAPVRHRSSIEQK